jgi:hypothetical protein
MDSVNSWWTDLAHERFWLAVSSEHETDDVLMIPAEHRAVPSSWVNDLPAYLAARDVVFHYDPEAQAIMSWSRAKGPGLRKEPGWSIAGTLDRSHHTRRSHWTVKLRGRKPLDAAVPVDEIARVQWDLFPALRVLEEKHGDPLYYPFAMGRPDETHTLPGSLFKLPSLFVDSFTPLASVARETPAGRVSKAPRRTASWWDALEGFLTEKPKEVVRPR